MQKKKEKILNNVEENDHEYNNDLKKGNQVVSVSNYDTYNSITKPKYNHTFQAKYYQDITFKYVNENGKLSTKPNIDRE